MAYKDPLDPRNREARLRHYRKNKEAYKERARQARRRNFTITQLEKERPCADCGKSYPPWVMQFDHVGEDKDREVCKLARAGVSAERLMAEIKKCEVVCANCHAERTHQRANQRPEAEVAGRIPNPPSMGFDSSQACVT